MNERIWMTVEDVLRILDANVSRQDIEKALIANLPSNGGPCPQTEAYAEGRKDEREELMKHECKFSSQYLCELVEALENAYISSWQSTAKWQTQLDAAREHLNRLNV